MFFEWVPTRKCSKPTKLCRSYFKTAIFSDKESVKNTEAKAHQEWSKAHDRAAFLTGTILMYEQLYERAKPLIDRVANSNTHNSTVSIITVILLQ